MIQQPSQQTNRLPPWLAGLAVLLLLGGSAFAIYRLVWQDRAKVAVETVPVSTPAFGGRGPGGFNRGNRPDPQPSSVASVSRSLSGRIRARHGGVVVYGIPKSGGGYDSILEFENARSWVSPAQWDDQILAGRPMQYPALATAINLTPDQKQRIEALTYQPPLSAVEKTEFEKLFTAWVKASQKEKDAAAEELSRAVESASKKHLDEAKTALLKRCTEVTTILTDAQMQQIRNWFGSAPKVQTPAPRQAPAAVAPESGAIQQTGARPQTGATPAALPQK